MFAEQCIHEMVVSHGLVVSLFLAGLVGGVTHCAGMCSPFVLAQTGDGPNIRKLGSSLLLPYHLGRMTTYVMLAVLVSVAVGSVFVSPDIKAIIAVPMLVLAGVIFLASAFPRLSGFFPWVANIQVAMPYKLITKLSSKLMKDPHVLKRYGLGILLGFMPCGLVVSAVLASATAPNVLQVVLAMSAFTVGTMPALVLIALGGRALRVKYPKASVRLSQGAMVISSLWLFALAGMMVF